MNNYHEDEKTRIANERCAGIVIKDGKILLIHRIKNGYEYWVFPGGHRRQDEVHAEVAVREIEEETSIIVKNPKLVFEFRNYNTDNYDFYFTCEWVKGEEPKLNGEELIRQCEENFYEPMWIELDKIEELNILPKFAKEWVKEGGGR